MAEIIITMQNPKSGDVGHLIRKFWSDGWACFFRGDRRANIQEGERVYFQYFGAIWGFAVFDKYDYYSGDNLQGNHVEKPNSIYLKPPLYKFDDPISLGGQTVNYGWRYVDPSKYSHWMISSLKQSTAAVELEGGWFVPGADYTVMDPDPLSGKHLATAVRVLDLDEPVNQAAKRAIVRDWLSCAPSNNSVVKKISRLYRSQKFDESFLLLISLFTDFEGLVWKLDWPYLRNVGFLYTYGLQMVVVDEASTNSGLQWEPDPDEQDNLTIYDMFSGDEFVLSKKSHTVRSISMRYVARCVVTGFLHAIAWSGHSFRVKELTRKGANGIRSVPMT